MVFTAQSNLAAVMIGTATAMEHVQIAEYQMDALIMEMTVMIIMQQ